MRTRQYEAIRRWGLRTLKADTMLRISVIGMTLDLLIAASTLAPSAPIIPQWPQFVLFPLIFVVHFSSVLRLTPVTTGFRTRFRWRDIVVGIPPAFGVAFVVLFVGVWLVEMTSITSIGGQPTISGGHYFLNDHGSLIPVTKVAYDHALVLQQRIFTLGPSVFFALGALVHYPRRETGTVHTAIAPTPQLPSSTDDVEQARELDLSYRVDRLRRILQAVIGLPLMLTFLVVEHFPVVLAAPVLAFGTAGAAFEAYRLTRASRLALGPYYNPVTGEVDIPGGRPALTVRDLWRR